MKKIFLILFVAWCFVSCTKREYPANEVNTGQPQFYVKANVDGKDILWQAGINNYRVFSSYEQDSNKVYNLISDFKQSNCSGKCPSSIRFQINDYKISAIGANITIDSSLSLKNYPFADSLSGYGFPVSFTSVANKDVESYSWDFGDGTTSNLANPKHIYTREGKYKITLNSKSINGNASSVWNELNVKINQSLNANITATVNSLKSVNFASEIYGSQNSTNISWDFGNGVEATGTPANVVYDVEGSYPVRLKIEAANKEVTNLNYNVVTQKDRSSFAINFISNLGVPQKNSLALSKVIIKYVDENGIDYTSLNKNQSSTNTLQIVSVENYDANENNEATKKLKIKFNCTVYNGNKALSINNAEAIIAVAYK